MSEQTLTTEQKRAQRIAQLRARLQKEEAKQAEVHRKKRDGQLFSWGIMVEEIFKSADEAGRQPHRFRKKTSQREESTEGSRGIYSSERRGCVLNFFEG